MIPIYQPSPHPSLSVRPSFFPRFHGSEYFHYMSALIPRRSLRHVRNRMISFICIKRAVRSPYVIAYVHRYRFFVPIRPCRHYPQHLILPVALFPKFGPQHWANTYCIPMTPRAIVFTIPHFPPHLLLPCHGNLTHLPPRGIAHFTYIRRWRRTTPSPPARDWSPTLRHTPHSPTRIAPLSGHYLLIPHPLRTSLRRHPTSCPSWAAVTRRFRWMPPPFTSIPLCATYPWCIHPTPIACVT